MLLNKGDIVVDEIPVKDSLKDPILDLIPAEDRQGVESLIFNAECQPKDSLCIQHSQLFHDQVLMCCPHIGEDGEECGLTEDECCKVTSQSRVIPTKPLPIIVQ